MRRCITRKIYPQTIALKRFLWFLCFHIEMSSENDVLLQMYAKAPSPIRDYYGIIITKDHVSTDTFHAKLLKKSKWLKVVLNIWNISHGPHTFPKKYKKHVSEFLDDRELQYHIENTFGTHVRDFVMGLAMKEYNLQYIPTKIFLKILKLLAARDIMNLSQTSKIFFKVRRTCLRITHNFIKQFYSCAILRRFGKSFVVNN